MTLSGGFVDGGRPVIAPRGEAAAVTVLIGLFLFLSGSGAVVSSPTVDEFAHLPAGYTYLTRGDLSLYDKNPPLVKMMAALPLLVFRPPLENGSSDSRSGWRPWLAADEFMRRNGSRYHQAFLAGRAIILLMGALLGLGIWYTARSLYGRGGGLVSLVLFVLSPAFLTHAGLVTTDLGAALFIFASFWAFLFLLDRPGPLRGIPAGTALGAALLVKFTALLLVPLYLTAAAGARWWYRRRHGPDYGGFSHFRLAGGCLVMIAVAWTVLAAGYGFELTGDPLGALPPLHSDLLAALQSLLPDLRLPLPRSFLSGLDQQLYEARHYGFPNYLLGEWYMGGRWYYFPLAMMVKTPLPVLAAVAGGTLLWRESASASGESPFSPVEIALMAAALWLFAGITFRNQIQIGVRYLLPVFPFVFVLAGRLGSTAMLSRGGRWYRAVLALAGILLLSGTLRVYPHFLSYFNLLAGGAGKGHRVLLDSNIDWGQDLPALARYMRDHGDETVHLAYFGHANPGLYGIRYEPFTRAGRPGLTAISVAYLRGFDYPGTYTSPWSHVPLNETGRYLERAPAGRAGYSIYLYRD